MSSNKSPTQSRPPRRLWPTLRAVLRTRIVAGMLTVIPIYVTWLVVKFVFDTMKSATEPIAWKVAEIIQRTNPRIVASVVERYVGWIVPALAVLLTLMLLYALGVLTASVVGRRIILFFERIFERLPMVQTVYRSTKQMVMAFSPGSQMNFQRVVLVEFPRPGMKCLAFLTSIFEDVDTKRKLAAVFIATTPNPTTGYMQILPLEDVSETDWTVEEAVKLLISGGLLCPPTLAFDKIHPVQVNTPLVKPPEQ